MNVFDIVYLFAYFIILYCSVLWFSVFLVHRNTIFNNPKAKIYPSLTVLVPAYNEAGRIGKCLDSLLSLDYPKLNIIAINDGSTDNTLEVLKKYEKKGVKIINKKNSGKADSLNHALKHVNTELFMCMDADSYPSPDSVKKMVGYMEGENVAGVSPALKIDEVNTFMQKIQWVEYIFSIFLRKVFSIFQCQYVLPGPGSIYRTKIIKDLGGFDKESITEDMEIAFRLQSKKYDIENSIDAYVYTEAPQSFRGLFKQRVRWYRGYLHNVRKYLHLIGNPEYGNLGVFLIPINFIWVFILFAFFFIPLYTVASNLMGFLNVFSLVGIPPINLFLGFDIMYVDFYSFFLAAFITLAVATIMVSLKSSNEKIEFKKRYLFYIGYMFIYPLLFSIFWISTVFYEIFGAEKKW
ncbi:MAG: glycosyltransferase family 2 protein [Candidatus Aenigmarchaeota archaeon]|nr:glycosyltransferase family 2 protein [Candidatus Aenigmarchaeota archaeon]